MAFQFAYSLDSSAISTIKDFPLDTVVNYQNAVGTNGVKKGDLVFLNAGLVRRTTNVATPKAIGIVEGTEFLGLVAQGQPMAAVEAAQTAQAVSTTRNPNGVVKVRVESDSVYRVPVKSGQTAAQANVGGQYGISQDAAGDQTIDLTQVTNILVKVVDYSVDGKTVFVIMSTNTTF